MERPKNWPENVAYLASPSHSKSLSAPQRSALKRQSDALPVIPASFPSGPSQLVKIAPILDPQHPAHGQFGLVATRSLKPGSLILPYIGVVHPDGHEHEKSDYDLSLDRGVGLAVDAARSGNEARFINDYRGAAIRPNAEFQEVWSARFQERCMAVYVLAEGKNSKGKGGIAKGQEILVSYGKGFWGHRKEDDALRVKPSAENSTLLE